MKYLQKQMKTQQNQHLNLKNNLIKKKQSSPNCKAKLDKPKE